MYAFFYFCLSARLLEQDKQVTLKLKTSFFACRIYGREIRGETAILHLGFVFGI